MHSRPMRSSWRAASFCSATSWPATTWRDVMNTVAIEPAIEAKQRLGVATGAALLVAGIILVTVVLPAEFAVDPLGTGAKLGLMDLGVTGKQVAALESAK